MWKKKRELEEIRLLQEEKQGVSQPAAEPEQSAKLNYEQEKERQRRERQRQRRKEELEEQIEALENKLKDWEAELCLPEIYQDYEQALLIQTNIDEARQKLDQLVEEWSDLAEE